MKKKHLLGLLLSVLSSGIYAQQNNKKDATFYQKQNEIKLNGLRLLLGAAELDYQYLINEESGVGVDVSYTFDDADLVSNWYIAPYYRQYFGDGYASGFFVEGFSYLNSMDDDIYEDDDYISYTTEENVIDLALGIGVGVKIVTGRNFTLEVDLEVGRQLFNTNRDYDIIAKGGLQLGYRF